MPGMELTSVRTFVPGQANIGYTKPPVVSRVSRTNPRNASLRRSRRGRWTGNVMRASPPNAAADKILQSNPPDPPQKIVWLQYPRASPLRAKRAPSWDQSPRIAHGSIAQRAPPPQRIPIEIET